MTLRQVAPQGKIGGIAVQVGTYTSGFWVARHWEEPRWSPLLFVCCLSLAVGLIVTETSRIEIDATVCGGLIVWGGVGMLGSQGEPQRLNGLALTTGMIIILAMVARRRRIWDQLDQLTTRAQELEELRSPNRLTVRQVARSLGVSNERAHWVMQELAKREPGSAYDALGGVLTRNRGRKFPTTKFARVLPGSACIRELAVRSDADSSHAGRVFTLGEQWPTGDPSVVVREISVAGSGYLVQGHDGHDKNRDLFVQGRYVQPGSIKLA